MGDSDNYADELEKIWNEVTEPDREKIMSYLLNLSQSERTA